MDANSCRRELTVEIPANVVRREAESITRHFQKHARVSGFRPGKVPLDLVRRRFAPQIQEQLLQQLIPEHFRERVKQEKMNPVDTPQIEDVRVPKESEETPLSFKAVFEVMPEIEMKPYKGLQVPYSESAVTEEDVEQSLHQIQDQAATFAPVEGRALADGDFAFISFEGRPIGSAGGPVKMENVLCEIGGAGTLAEFTEHLRGAEAGAERVFQVSYPQDYRDPRLAGKTLRCQAKVHAIEQKQLPELNDDLARDLGEFQTLAELRANIRQDLERQRREEAEAAAKQKLLDQLVDLNPFPVPGALVERQVERRLEQMLRGLAGRGVNIEKLKLDWKALRAGQRQAAEREVKAALLLDRIAEEEKIQVEESELEREIERLASSTKQSTAQLRARLTADRATDRIKHRLLSEKTHDFLYRNAQRVASSGS